MKFVSGNIDFKNSDKSWEHWDTFVKNWIASQKDSDFLLQLLVRQIVKNLEILRL